MSSPALRSASMSSALATLAAPAASAAAAPTPRVNADEHPSGSPSAEADAPPTAAARAFHGGFVLVRVVAVDAPHVVLPVAFVGVDGVCPGESTRGGVPPLQPRHGENFVGRTRRCHRRSRRWRARTPPSTR